MTETGNHKSPRTEKSILEQAAESAIKSGNRFHANVKLFLNKKGWETIVSPYYVDILSDQPREIDIIAWKDFKIPTLPHFNDDKYVRTYLFIDCKYLTQGELFWSDTIDRKRQLELVTSMFHYDMPQYGHDLIRSHHYLPADNRVVKLFNTIGNNTSDRDPVYKGIIQALHSQIYHATYPGMVEMGNTEHVKYTFRYPAVIFQSFENVCLTDFNNPDQIESCKDFPSLLTEVSYAYRGNAQELRNVYSLIDLVNGERIDEWIGRVELDVKDSLEIISVKEGMLI